MNSPDTTAAALDARDTAADSRLSTARRVYLTAFGINAALTLLCAVSYFTGFGATYVGEVRLDARAWTNILVGFLFFTVLWGFVWLGIKALLLAKVAKFSRAERRAAFGSRIREPFDVADYTARHSERRIRIVDMIGRRGRFITIGMAGFFYLF